jgi:hypothetical protein
MAVGVLISALTLVGALVLYTRHVTRCRTESVGDSSEDYLGAEAIVPPEPMHYLTANSKGAHPRPSFSRLGTRITEAA